MISSHRLQPLIFGLISSVFLAVVIAPSVFAQSLGQDDSNSVNNDTVWYKAESGNSGGAGSCTTILQGSDRVEQTWNYFKGQGLNDQQTAGVMGNIEQESHFDPEIMQIGGDSQDPYDAGSLGWGIVQWSGNAGPRSTGDKVTAIYNQTGVSGPVYTLSTQLDMVWEEMKGTSPTGVQEMLKGLEQINDISQAAVYFRINFEGGTDPLSPDGKTGIREFYAQQIYAKYAGTNTGSNSGPSSCTITTTSGNCSVNKIVYAPEYSQQQLAQIFGDPGTASSHPAMDANLTNVDFLGHSVQVNKLIASCLEAVAADWKSNNITYQIQSMGCYRFDSDNGTSNIGLSSYHTYGAACDINPNTNNFYDTGSVPYNPNCPASSGVVDSGSCYDMPPQVVKIFAAHGFYWGGNFHSVKDYMHFEWHGVVPQ